MYTDILHTPEGVRDIYGSECEKKLYLKDLLLKLLMSYGYSPIETPEIEFIETFAKEVGTTGSKDMFKLFDHDGNTLCLRPDMTPPIVRCACRYFSDFPMPKRFCYAGNTFISHKSFRGRRFEYTQLGAEYLGEGSADVDAEIVAMMIKAMDISGLKDYKVIVGHAGISAEALSKAGLSYGFIDSAKELSEFRDRAGADEGLKDALNQMIALEGALCDHGVGNRVVYEPGMNSNYAYYTGIIFSVYSYGCGQPVATGGRYDKLAEHFGAKDSAIGFAITVDCLMEALKNTGCDIKDDIKKMLIVYSDKKRSEAISKAKELRENGEIAELMRESEKYTKEDMDRYRHSKGIENVLYMS